MFFLLLAMFLVKTFTVLQTKCYKRTVGLNSWRPIVQYSEYKVILIVCVEIVDEKVWEIKKKNGIIFTILPASNPFMFLWKLLCSVHVWLHYMVDETWLRQPKKKQKKLAEFEFEFF